MKQRNGFVSNSSSSSFIIQWKCNLLEDGEGVDTAMIYLFELFGTLYDEETGKKLKENWLDNLSECDSHLKETVEEVIKNSKPIGKSGDMFETDFHTTMRNDVTDYGPAAHQLLMALTVDEIEQGKGRFEIVHMRTEDMGC